MENTTKLSHIEKSNYLIIFFIIFISSSFYALSLSGNLTMSLTLIVGILSIFINRKNLSINYSSYFLLFFVLISSCLTLIINNDDLYNYIIFWISLISAYMIYISINIEQFMRAFVNIIYYLCIISIVTFCLLYVYPSIFDVFPSITNTANVTVKNLFFVVIYKSDYMKSNFGLFWEPGAFQTFINIALFIQLMIFKKIDAKKVTIFLIAILSTFSTTGYICALLLILIFVLNNNKIKKINFKYILLFLLITVFSVVFYMGLDDHIKFKVFGKLQILFSQNNLQNADYGSTIVRLNAIKYPFMSYLDNLFFGVGFDNLFQQSVIYAYLITCTPINWFALFGTSVGILFNFCLYKWSYSMTSGFLMRIVIFVFLLATIISENYNRNAFFLAFLLYGSNFTKRKTIK